MPGKLPRNRTTGGAVFEVKGTDLAAPTYYRDANKRERKSYLVSSRAVFSSSTSRANQKPRSNYIPSVLGTADCSTRTTENNLLGQWRYVRESIQVVEGNKE